MAVDRYQWSVVSGQLSENSEVSEWSPGRRGRVNLLGNVGNPGILGNLGKSRICWLRWCVVVGASPVTTVVVNW